MQVVQSMAEPDSQDPTDLSYFDIVAPRLLA